MSDLTSKFEEVQLIYKNRVKASNRVRITSSADVYSILKQNWDLSQIELLEECKLLMLDNSLRVMSIASISKGGMTGTVVDPRVVFSISLKRRAHRIILAHNHPSGNLKPSIADLNLTRQIKEGGALLNIRLDDHLIITSDGYYSMSDEGSLSF